MDVPSPHSKWVRDERRLYAYFLKSWHLKTKKLKVHDKIPVMWHKVDSPPTIDKKLSIKWSFFFFSRGLSWNSIDIKLKVQIFLFKLISIGRLCKIKMFFFKYRDGSFELTFSIWKTEMETCYQALYKFKKLKFQ